MLKVIFLCGFICSVLGGLEKGFIKIGGFTCPKEEAAMGRCLKDVLNNYIPNIATGLPEYAIPPCEPLLIPSLTVKQSAGPIHVTSSYHDVIVKGLSGMHVKEVRVNAKKHQVVAKLYIPELRMKGNYKVSGQLLVLPIEGDGTFSAKYSDIDAVVTIVLDRLHHELAPDALACKYLDVKFHMGQASMQLENLFGGNNELGKATNRFLNENWQKLAEELQTPMEEALRDFLKPLVDHAFATLNADDILY